MRIKPGLEYVDGTRLEAPWTFTFKTPCAEMDTESCIEAPAQSPDDVQVSEGGETASGGCHQGVDSASSMTSWALIFGLMMVFTLRRRAGVST